jgi:hypothetical protein
MSNEIILSNKNILGNEFIPRERVQKRPLTQANEFSAELYCRNYSARRTAKNILR